MARVYYNEDRIVVTGRTNINVFSFKLDDCGISLNHERCINVDVAIEETRKLPEAINATISETPQKNGAGDTNDTENTPGAVTKNVNHDTDKQILSGAFSSDGSLFAVVTSMKTCLVFDVSNDWKQRRSAFRVPKSPTAVVFDNQMAHVIVADRAGNVCRYKLDHHSDQALNMHLDINGEESICEGESLLGHVSMVLDVALSNDGRFVLSADRDEKLRISRYPQSFVIHTFCLGHTSYINSLCTKQHIAFTAGGDGTLRAWDMNKGSMVAILNCFAKQPIRCMRILKNTKADAQDKTQLAIVLEGVQCVSVVSFDMQHSVFAFDCEIKAPTAVLDVAFCDTTHVIAITKECILLGEVRQKGEFGVVEGVMGSVVDDLRNSRDGIANLEKKVGFDNMTDYQQRKNERIQKRKRKAEETTSI